MRAPRIVLLVVSLLAGVAFAAANFPPLTGRVVDAAGILSAATRADLAQRLEAHERATHQQVVVVTVPDLGGLPIEDYGYQLGRRWGIGEKSRNTGALLIVAKAEHKVRIEVGYGLEGELTDAMSSNIINTRIVPAFRKGDYDAGVRAGVGAMLAVLGGQAEAGARPKPTVGEGDRTHGKTVVREFHVGIFWLIVLVIVLSSFGGRGGRGGIARAIFWGSVLNGMSRGGRGGRGGRWGGGGGGFGGGGGGFSGGGGSFGGGGASGSW
jgi:uncharacterized protein